MSLTECINLCSLLSCQVKVGKCRIVRAVTVPSTVASPEPGPKAYAETAKAATINIVTNVIVNFFIVLSSFKDFLLLVVYRARVVPNIG